MARKQPICGIYIIVSPSGKIYVGQSRNAVKRFQSYLGRTDKVNGQPKLANSFKKHGARNHTFTVIEECEFDQLNTRERYWQEYYNACSRSNLNCTLTRTDEMPTIVSEDTRKKMSENAKKRMARLVNDPEYMRKMKENGLKRRGIAAYIPTEEHRAAARERELLKGGWKGENNYWYGKDRSGSKNTMYGRKHSEETKAKISAIHKGKKHTEEAKKVMSEKRSRGGNVKARLVINTETGVYYSCILEASESISHYKYSTLKAKVNGSVNNNTPFRFA